MNVALPSALNIASLCAGIGGLDLALRIAIPGTRSCVYVEREAYAAATLVARMEATHSDNSVKSAFVHGKINGTAQVLATLTPPLTTRSGISRGGLMPTLSPSSPIEQRIQAMYARYEAGLSLADVAGEFGITRQSVYKSFLRRGFALRQKPQPLPFVEFNGHRYTLRNNGYYGRTSGGRTLLHRDMWEHAIGPIPPGYDIHHVDDDKSHNELSNFECLPKDEHARLYPGRQNQHTKKRALARLNPEES